MDILINLFNSIKPLSQDEQNLIRAELSVVVVKKGTLYLEKDKTCKKIGFVVDGVFKVAKISDEGKELIQFFVTEGHFAVDVDSFTFQKASQDYIEALTNCTVIEMTHNGFGLLNKSIPDFEKIINQIKEQALLEKYNIKSEMISDDALTRYKKLSKRQPIVIKKISQGQIASFLGITQYTLSRIKQK